MYTTRLPVRGEPAGYTPRGPALSVRLKTLFAPRTLRQRIRPLPPPSMPSTAPRDPLPPPDSQPQQPPSSEEQSEYQKGRERFQTCATHLPCTAINKLTCPDDAGRHTASILIRARRRRRARSSACTAIPEAVTCAPTTSSAVSRASRPRNVH